MKSKKTFLIIAAALLGVALNVLLFSLVIIPAITQKSVFITPMGENAAVLSVEGAIMPGTSQDYSQNWVLDTLDDIINDDNNRALLLKINSPGGTIFECDEIYYKLLEYKETQRPIYAAMGQVAASGGYYIAAPADKIYANRNTITGSLGVSSGSFVDITGFLEKNGVRVKNIVSGKNKAMGSVLEAYTDEQIEIMQSIADEAYEQFIGIVSKERGLDLETVRKAADGRIFTANQALSLKLVDEIGTYRQAKDDMIEAEGLQGVHWKEYNYVPKQTFWDYIMNAKSNAVDDADLLVKLGATRIQLPRYFAEIEG